jgi:uncharacterized protein
MSKHLFKNMKNRLFVDNIQISSTVEIANSPLKKALGLMFRSRSSFLFMPFKKEKRISLHMFFVFFPIDVAFLDEKKKVIEIKKDFKPFTIYKSRKKAKCLMEMPSGSINKFNIKVRSNLTFSE